MEIKSSSVIRSFKDVEVVIKIESKEDLNLWLSLIGLANGFNSNNEVVNLAKRLRIATMAMEGSQNDN